MVLTLPGLPILRPGVHIFMLGFSKILHSDHKPLLGVFDNPSQVVSPWVPRWCVTLGAYNFKLVFLKGTENFTDWLSRYVTTKEQTTEVPVPADMLVNATFLESELRLTPGVVMSHQGADSDLKQVRKYIQEGWPPESELTASLKRYCTNHRFVSPSWMTVFGTETELSFLDH